MQDEDHDDKTYLVSQFRYLVRDMEDYMKDYGQLRIVKELVYAWFTGSFRGPKSWPIYKNAL